MRRWISRCLDCTSNTGAVVFWSSTAPFQGSAVDHGNAYGHAIATVPLRNGEGDTKPAGQLAEEELLLLGPAQKLRDEAATLVFDQLGSWPKLIGPPVPGLT